MKQMCRQSKLFEIVGALNTARGRTDLLHSRNQQRHKNADDCNNDQYFKQCERRSQVAFLHLI
jgi:hypothetical protein